MVSTLRARWSAPKGPAWSCSKPRKLIASPQHRSLVGLGYADAFAAADHVPEILAHHPIGLEGFEGAMIDGLRRKGAPNLELMPEGRGFLLVEFGADDRGTRRSLSRQLIDQLKHGSEPALDPPLHES